MSDEEMAAGMSEESWKSSMDYDVSNPAQAAEYLLRFKCWAKSDTSKAIRAVCEDHVRMRHDLARALPVVEAAGAVVEHWKSGHFAPYSADGDPSVVLLDALASAVRAAREPRTGERG